MLLDFKKIVKNIDYEKKCIFFNLEMMVLDIFLPFLPVDLLRRYFQSSGVGHNEKLPRVCF